MTSMIVNAVDAFSRAFSSSTSREGQATSSTQGKTMIHDIPAEVLCDIFSFLHGMVYQHSRDHPEEDTWLEQDLMSTSLFPYAPAAVSPFWRDVMSSLPKCWGRVVIFIDSPATPLPIIESQLSWSRDGQLDVFITRRAFCDVDARHERSQVVEIMDLVLPHIHRIREFSIKVMFSSSLPSILTDFHGNATMMLDLELQSKEDDGGSGRSESVVLTDREEFRCPKLKHLVIDGRNWYEAFKSDPQWTEKVASITELTISHFEPNTGESFSPHELSLPLSNIPRLRSLRIEDIVLHPSPEPLQLLYPGAPTFLYLEDLHDLEVITQIIGFLDPPNISLIRCTFEDELDDPLSIGSGGILKLINVSCDLAPLLRLWYGYALEVTDCPRFDDALLEEMSTQSNGKFDYAASVENLDICDCPDFSIAALQEFVESRMDLTWNEVSPRIHSIFCSGNVPSLSLKEKEWFEENLLGPLYYL